MSVHESVRAPRLVHVHLAQARLSSGQPPGQGVAVAHVETQRQVVVEALAQALVVVEQGGQAGGVVGLVARLRARRGACGRVAQGAAVLPTGAWLGGWHASWLACQRMKG